MSVTEVVKTIKEFRKKGYNICLSLDSTRPVYAVELSTQQDVKRFIIPLDSVSYQTLHDIVLGK